MLLKMGSNAVKFTVQQSQFYGKKKEIFPTQGIYTLGTGVPEK